MPTCSGIGRASTTTAAKDGAGGFHKLSGETEGIIPALRIGPTPSAGSTPWRENIAREAIVVVNLRGGDKDVPQIMSRNGPTREQGSNVCSSLARDGRTWTDRVHHLRDPDRRRRWIIEALGRRVRRNRVGVPPPTPLLRYDCDAGSFRRRATALAQRRRTADVFVHAGREGRSTIRSSPFSYIKRHASWRGALRARTQQARHRLLLGAATICRRKRPRRSRRRRSLTPFGWSSARANLERPRTRRSGTVPATTSLYVSHHGRHRERAASSIQALLARLDEGVRALVHQPAGSRLRALEARARSALRDRARRSLSARHRPRPSADVMRRRAGEGRGAVGGGICGLPWAYAGTDKIESTIRLTLT